MKKPSLEDRVVVVRAGLTDEMFSYDHWRAAQFASPWRERDALLVILKPDENATELAARIGAALGGVNQSAGRADAVTRFEVIDHRAMGEGEAHGESRGRVFSVMPCRVELSYQDSGRTLKVFVLDAAAPPNTEASE